MTKMYATAKPEYLHQADGVWFFNLNAEFIPGQAATESTPATVDQWVCDSVAVNGAPDRGKLIAAGMQARFSKDDEIALINKKLLGEEAAYALYQTYRESVKTQVTEAGFPPA